MRNALDRYGESRGRAGVIEPEEGDHSVHIDEKKGNLILHLAGGRYSAPLALDSSRGA
jgi:hypothetical protein